MANVGPALYRWSVHVASGRDDWLVGVRPAGTFWGRLTWGSVLLETLQGRPAAVERAEELVGLVEKDGPPDARPHGRDGT